LKPFFGGTYYPPDDYGGRPGFKNVLLRIAEAWQQDSARLIASSDDILWGLREGAGAPDTVQPGLDQSLLDRTYQAMKASYEPHYGGFGLAPKFPSPCGLNFMLRYYAFTLRQGSGQAGSSDALDMALFTLHKMADGGIHDHLGGGFHRYSVDERWHVPHFEKMLYDQGQLAATCLDAYQITHEKGSSIPRKTPTVLSRITRASTLKAHFTFGHREKLQTSLVRKKPMSSGFTMA
jgi:hypothetical protein